MPPGWLEDDDGQPVTDPAAFDRGEAELLWLGGAPETGAFKGFGLGLVVEVLAALVSGAGMGPSRRRCSATAGRPAPTTTSASSCWPSRRTRSGPGSSPSVRALFGTLLGCPPARSGPVSYPGWREAEQAEENRRVGVPMPATCT